MSNQHREFEKEKEEKKEKEKEGIIISAEISKIVNTKMIDRINTIFFQVLTRQLFGKIWFLKTKRRCKFKNTGKRGK